MDYEKRIQKLEVEVERIREFLFHQFEIPDDWFEREAQALTEDKALLGDEWTDHRLKKL